MKFRALMLSVFLVVALVVSASQAFGCPVCYGESDDQIIRGAELSVLFMVGITYTILMGGGALSFFLYRRRVRLSAADVEAS